MAGVVVDVEATCWDGLRVPQSEREIIEIGAVWLDAEFAEKRWFSEIVRPVRHPELSELCTQLTGIAQAEVAVARGFADVLASLVDWAGPGDHWLCSWGIYDRRQLVIDAEFHGVTLPAWFVSRHVNIRQGFTRWQGIDRCSPDDACGAAVVLGAWQRAHAALRARVVGDSGRRGR